MTTKKTVLTISLLISNRPDTIPRCLDSLKPIMEAIPSELILIDTSKDEEIRQLLLGYTDQVYQFEWCQDFAKARNEGLKRAKGEWFMFLDDDEWFVEYQELIDFFKSGEYRRYGYANYIVRNFSDIEYTAYTDSWVSRLVRISEDIRFEGKVHEVFRPIFPPEKYINAIANHSGYVFETEEKIREHFERNSTILLKVIEEEPYYLRWQAQMVQEYRSISAWSDMEIFCKKHTSKVTRLETMMDKNHLATLYAGWIESLLRQNRYEESISICKKALKDERSIELLKALCYLRMAENYLELGEWKTSKKYVEKYLDCYRELPKNEVLMREESNSLVVKMVFIEDNILSAYNMLLYNELQRGNIEAIEIYYEYLGWDTKKPILYGKLAEELIKVMATTEYRDIFGRMISDGCKKEIIRDYLCGEAQRLEEKDSSLFIKVANAFAQADEDYWFVWYCRIVLADEEGDIANIEDSLKGFMKSVLNGFYLPDKVHEIIQKNNIKIAKLWEEVLGDKWNAQISYYVKNQADALIDKLRIYLCDVFEPDDEKYIEFELLVKEKQILLGPDKSLLDYYNILKDYADFSVRYQEVKSMPVAMKISEFIQFENVDTIRALNKLKEIVDIRPEFADAIGTFLHAYPRLENERIINQSNEMIQLRNQVLQQVYMLRDNGMKQEALQIVQQLKGMFPGDKEILELENSMNN